MMMNDKIILQIDQLEKHFGKAKAVDGVSLTVKRGQIFGFLGPNGSGKTTTIGMVLGLLHPTAGKVTMFGESVSPSHTHPLRRVGALVGAPAIVPYLSARQNLELLAHLSPDLPPGRVDEILFIVNLNDAANRRTGQFSTGMKQRLGIGMALLHEPELLILDEPTNGMDPAGMREIRVLLSQLAEQKVTIFISSHLLHEVEQICDQVAVLKKGKVVAEGNVKDLLGEQTIVRVRVNCPNTAARCLHSLSGVTNAQPNGAYVSVSGVSSQEIVGHLTSNGIIPSEVSTGRPDLESIFLEVIDRNTMEV
jgi:ABC-2 type transport system ATP-binding protein